MLGYLQDASETPFKWHFAGGPIMACFQCGYFDHLSSHQLKQKQNKKNVVKVGPTLTKVSGFAHDCDVKYQLK